MRWKPYVPLHERPQHRWFAWYPVTAEDGNGGYTRVWMEPVWRRVTYLSAYHCFRSRFYLVYGAK